MSFLLINSENIKRKVNNIDKTNIINMYKRGLKQKEISKIYNIDQGWISRIIKKGGMSV